MTSIDPDTRAALGARLGFDPEVFRWEGVEEKTYKLGVREERGMCWRGVTRHTLTSQSEFPAAFETRYFEFEPGGYSSLEKHRHVHVIVVLRGAGRALIGDRVHEISAFDVLYVPPLTPHRWLNAGAEPFGFLCTVDGERDRPGAVDDEEWDRLRADPGTAPYVF
jgi:quercetin dioxygenase-like cupin family protein